MPSGLLGTLWVLLSDFQHSGDRETKRTELPHWMVVARGILRSQLAVSYMKVEDRPHSYHWRLYMKTFAVTFTITFVIVYLGMILIEPAAISGVVAIGGIGGFLSALAARIAQ